MNAPSDARASGLSRLASPAGFALVLLLFLLLPFLSVSCDVPGVGSIGADYSGGHLVLGDEPEVEVPADLTEMAEQLPGGGGENSEPPPDPGVQVLAIIAGLVMLAGVATPLLPRLRARSYAAAGVAVLAAVLVVVTQVAARSNLTSELRADAQNLSDGDQGAMPDLDEIVDEMIHTEIGFWLTLFGLMLIAVLSIGLVIRDMVRARPATSRTTGTGTDPEGAADTPVAGFFHDDDPSNEERPSNEPKDGDRHGR